MMSIRYLWVVSINSRTVLYLRQFPNIEKRAQRMGLLSVDLKSDEQLVGSVLSALAIAQTSDDFDCRLSNQLPVIELNYKSSQLWPVLVLEQNGILFCSLPLIDSDSRDLIVHKSVPICFTALQTFSYYFTNEKNLSWIEWFITSMIPLGTFISSNKYEPISSQSKKVSKIDAKQQNDLLKLIINELISGTKDDKELVYGSISVDHSSCSTALLENGLLTLQIRNTEALNLVLPSNCSAKDSEIQIKLPIESNPLHAIHYKCNSSYILPQKKFLSYNYSISRDSKQNSLYRIYLTISLKNSSQMKFSFFNIQFKQMSENNSLSPTKSTLTFGQLRHEPIGLFWVIGTKFPKSGQIKLNFDIICLNSKLIEMETICNFKIDNFQSNLMYCESEHLSIDDINFVAKGKVPILIESSLTSIDYKLFAEFV